MALLGICLTALVVGACGAGATAGKSENHEASTSSNLGHLPQGSERVKLGSADFTIRTENPYWPTAPGDRWVYKETDEKGTKFRVEVTVTDRTEEIANGVETRVITTSSAMTDSP